MNESFYAYVENIGDQIVVRGLSWNKKNWFSIPDDQSNIRFHPEIQKRVITFEALKKNGKFRITRLQTKSVKKIYLNDFNHFIFNGQILPLEDSNLSYSIGSENLNDDNLDSNSSEDNDLSVSKRFKGDAGVIKISSVVNVEKAIDELLNKYGKFKLFGDISAEAFLTSLEQFSVQNFGNCDILVPQFIYLIDRTFYDWFTYLNETNEDLDWTELKKSFKKVTEEYSFELVNSLSDGLDAFLKVIAKFEDDNLIKNIESKPYETYFRMKEKYSKLILNLNDYQSKLLALGSLKEKNLFLKLRNLIKSDELFYLRIAKEDQKLFQLKVQEEAKEKNDNEKKLKKDLKNYLELISKLLKENKKLKEKPGSCSN